MHHADVIIIGAGIAGLYTAYILLEKHNFEGRVVILEKEGRVGGRMGVVSFAGVDVVTGAGIGRKSKDRLLQELMKDLGIDTHEFKIGHHYIEKHTAVKSDISKLKKALTSDSKSQTFKEYASAVLKDYEGFVRTTGYTDFQDASAYETVKHYGLDDTLSGWTGLSIDWNTLLYKLVSLLKHKGVRICLNTEVTEVNTNKNEYQLHIANKQAIWVAPKIVCATPISVISRLLPAVRSFAADTTIIRGQPFIRIYAQFSKATRDSIAKAVPMFTVLSGPLQKIIPIAPSLGVYMIAYADNESALYLKDRTKEEIELQVQSGLHMESRPTIIRMKSFFWPEGTHYYKPVSNKKQYQPVDQNPAPGVFVVGEAVSRENQGWVEGALESVLVIENVLLK